MAGVVWWCVESPYTNRPFNLKCTHTRTPHSSNSPFCFLFFVSILLAAAMRMWSNEKSLDGIRSVVIVRTLTMHTWLFCWKLCPNIWYFYFSFSDSRKCERERKRGIEIWHEDSTWTLNKDVVNRFFIPLTPFYQWHLLNLYKHRVFSCILFIFFFTQTHKKQPTKIENRKKSEKEVNKLLKKKTERKVHFENSDNSIKWIKVNNSQCLWNVKRCIAIQLVYRTILIRINCLCELTIVQKLSLI